MDAVRGGLRDGSGLSPAGSGRGGDSKDSIFAMNLAKTFRANWCRAARAAVAIAIASFAIAAIALMARSEGAARKSEKTGCYLSAAPTPSADSGDLSRVKNYPLDFAGDHSLSAATVTEQPAAGHTTYTVRLQLASGAEQSLIVAGPPGGLQVEMHDMTGDHVPNDVVLRPALFSWLPTVLVNDGHDHFAVVVAGADAGDFSSPQDLGSRRQNTQTFAFLRSSGFKLLYLPASKRVLAPRFQHQPLSASEKSRAWGVNCTPRSDRAPPSIASI